MTRTQLILALLIAAVLALGAAFVASVGGFHSAGERFRDTAAALKRMYRQRPAEQPREGTPQQVAHEQLGS